ncbi:MAG: 4-hydroxy-tetrahydrodipicolinate reductase [Bacteroidetes bacterium]|nr:4-hydroxy-tetrahydrodipicolinate reductase [Bacteroidota bacterium]
MNIAIIGYGRMGHEIERVLVDRGHQIKFIIDQDNFEEIHDLNTEQVDVAIEFTNPTSAYANILHCFNANIPVISGTTGWTDKLAKLKQISISENKGFLYASNFSVGVNVLFALNKMLAKIMNTFPAYSVAIEEIHHTKKLDSPSGTAITLAQGIINNIDRLNSWNLADHSTNDILGINAIRRGEVPGIHEIKYESSFDTLELSHSAKSREGFVLGAVLAAEFMQNKKGFFEMNDVLHLKSF